MAFAQNIRHLARKAAAATAITATASCEDAPTLREWLQKDTFSAAFSQGFGCEAASIGVADALVALTKEDVELCRQSRVTVM